MVRFIATLRAVLLVVMAFISADVTAMRREFYVPPHLRINQSPIFNTIKKNIVSLEDSLNHRFRCYVTVKNILRLLVEGSVDDQNRIVLKKDSNYLACDFTEQHLVSDFLANKGRKWNLCYVNLCCLEEDSERGLVHVPGGGHGFIIERDLSNGSGEVNFCVYQSWEKTFSLSEWLLTDRAKLTDQEKRAMQEDRAWEASLGRLITIKGLDKFFEHHYTLLLELELGTTIGVTLTTFNSQIQDHAGVADDLSVAAEFAQS